MFPPQTRESIRPSTESSESVPLRSEDAARRNKIRLLRPITSGPQAPCRSSRGLYARNARKICWLHLRTPDLPSPIPTRWPSCSGNTCPSSSSHQIAPGGRPSEVARSGQTVLCCPVQENRPEKYSCPRCLCGSPPSKIQQQLMKHFLQEPAIRHTTQAPLNFVNSKSRPRMYRRIYVPERPFVRWQLPVRVHIPLAQQQNELFLRKIRIDQRDGNRMKRQIPRRIPRILPFVRHRNNVVVVQVRPIMVSPLQSLLRRRRSRRIAVQPGAHVIVIELLVPHHACKRLPHHPPGILRQFLGNTGNVELVSLFLSQRKQLVKSIFKIIRGRNPFGKFRMHGPIGNSRC